MRMSINNMVGTAETQKENTEGKHRSCCMKVG